MTIIRLPDELINYIFTYCQGSTNKVVKKYIKYSKKLLTGLIGLSKINREYGFKIIQMPRLIKSICYHCPVCHIQLLSFEYKSNINYHGERMCSRDCLLEYDSAISLLHLSY